MAATHFGHCQICGRQQKVTGKRLAKHGYTIRYGWQMGECFGSNSQPYELSNDRLLDAIKAAKAYILQTEATIERLQASPMHGDGMVMAIGADRRHAAPCDYYLRQVKLIVEEGKIVARDTYGRIVHLRSALRGAKTVEEAARELANVHITRLGQSISQARESIPYMQARLDSWKPAPLIPISAAELEAAAPRVHYQVKRYGYTTTACSASATGAHRNANKDKTTDATKVTCEKCAKEAARLADKAARLAEAAVA
jgi:hypothetical protein